MTVLDLPLLYHDKVPQSTQQDKNLLANDLLIGMDWYFNKP